MTPQAPRLVAVPALAQPLPRWLRGWLLVLVLAGAAALVREAGGAHALRAWQAYMVNLLFWSGIAQAGLAFAGIHEMTQAQWGRPIRRVAEATATFLPVSFLLLMGLYGGRGRLFPWLANPAPHRRAWLNVPFLFARNALAFGLLAGLGIAWLSVALRPEAAAGHGGTPWARALHRFLQRGWRGAGAEGERKRRALALLAPAVAIAYGLGLTLIAFDLVMALDPQWSSTLFGAYFFVGNLYAGLAAVAVLAALARRLFRLEAAMPPPDFHDLGKLLFAFCMLTGYLLYSQLLTIWYGNLPEEAGFILTRWREGPWALLARGCLLSFLVGPFLVLLNRRVKERPGALAAVGVAILAGMWGERFLLVAPSLWPGPDLPFGVPEVLVTLGFGALFLLALLGFGRGFPWLPAPAGDPAASAADRGP